MYLVEWKRMFLKLEITLCLVFHRYVMYFFLGIKLHYIIIYFTYVKMSFFLKIKQLSFILLQIFCVSKYLFSIGTKNQSFCLNLNWSRDSFFFIKQKSGHLTR